MSDNKLNGSVIYQKLKKIVSVWNSVSKKIKTINSLNLAPLRSKSRCSSCCYGKEKR